MKKIIILLIISTIIISGCGFIKGQLLDEILEPQVNKSSGGVIVNMPDGDTVHIEDKYTKEIVKVRVLGVDFIDKHGVKQSGEKRIQKWLDYGISEEHVVDCYNKGNAELRNKWMNQTVSLEYDPGEDTIDKYGRHLAYVTDSEGYFLENDVLLGGYGVVYDIGALNCKYCQRFKEINQRVVDEKTGCLWSYYLGDSE